MDNHPGKLQELLDSLPVRPDELSSYRLDALRASLFKKYVPKGGDVALSRAALEKFSAFNRKIQSFKVDDRFCRTELFGTWKDLLYKSFYSGEYQTTSFTLAEMLDRGRCGPGVSLHSSDQSFFRKMFDSPMSCTSDKLRSFYRASIRGPWVDAELLRHQTHGNVCVNGSRMTTVPKNKDNHRTICVEPTLNMFFQLGAKQILEDILVNCHGFSRDRQQEINKDLAREGSVTGAFATLDLSMASDSLSLDLMRKLLPKDIFDALDLIRSHTTEILGTEHTLGMISTMGNGFTFHLMTLTFVCLIKALCIVSGIRERFAVFGDDLIIDSRLVKRLIFCLRISGFRVNEDKSFTSGFFRESCGGDYYKGHDVRGVYISSLDSWSDIYSAFNRLHMWSLRHNISILPLLEYLVKLAPFRPVPLHSSFDSGFIITSDHLSSPKRGKHGGLYYRPLCPVPRTYSADDLCNPYGAVIAFIGGYIRNRSVSLPSKAKYCVRKKFTPNWDEWSSIHFILEREHRVGYLTRQRDQLASGLTSRGLSLSWDQLLS